MKAAERAELADVQGHKRHHKAGAKSAFGEVGGSNEPGVSNGTANNGMAADIAAQHELNQLPMELLQQVQAQVGPPWLSWSAAERLKACMAHVQQQAAVRTASQNGQPAVQTTPRPRQGRRR